MNRTALRECAFQLLYSLEIQQDNGKEQIELFFESNNINSKYEKEYMIDIVNGITSNSNKILSTIEKNLKQDWDINRISKINLCILKLAIYEILYKDIPFKAEINEAVELAKKYGDDHSKAFIHGVLASVVKDNNIA